MIRLLINNMEYGLIYGKNYLYTENKKKSLNKLLGTSIQNELPYNASIEKTLHIPLQFWFNRNIGMSLPLVALTYTSVKISFKIRN